MMIAKDLEWTRKYIEAVRPMLPRLKQLKRLSSKRANKKFVQRVHGICHHYSDRRHYKITLYISKTSVVAIKPLHINLIQYSTMEILRTLAHELAHLEHWDHTPDHESLTSSIILVFMTMLKAEGYESEEAEAKLVKGFIIE
jgi:hypothetical protein